MSMGNTSFGYVSASANTTGERNTAIGEAASLNTTTGWRNTSVGNAALFLNNEGNENSAIGSDALFRNKSDANTALGSHSLYYNESGKYNTALGWDAGPLANNLNNSTALGASSIVNASNKIRLGDALVTVVEGPVSYTVSDGRFKGNVSEDDIIGLAFINCLRPVVYNFDTKKFQAFLTQNMPDSIQKKYFENKDFNSSTNIRQSGFIAQEVELAAKETGYDFNGLHIPESKDDNYSLAYGQFVVPLVKSVQELSKQNDELRKEIAELRTLIMDKKTEGSITLSESGAKLYQNAPNPFTQSTTIKYSLPASATKASILIKSSMGIIIKEYQLNSKAGQAVNISGGQLSAGTYTYSLFVDDKLVDTKKMVLTQR